MMMQPESEKQFSGYGVSDYTETVVMNLYRTISIIALHMVKVRVTQIHRLVPYSLRLLSNGLHSDRAYIRSAENQCSGECLYYWIKNSTGNSKKIEIGKMSQTRVFEDILKNGTIVLIGSEVGNDSVTIENSKIKCLYGKPGEIHIPLYNSTKITGVLSFDTMHRDLHSDFRIVHPLRIASILIANLLEWSTVQNKKGESISGYDTSLSRADQGNEIDLLKKNLHLKNKLLSTVSHELRTPLTGIISLTQALRMSEISLSDHEKETFLKIIENEGKRLASLIRELLDFSMAEMEELELSFSEFSLYDLVKDVTVLVGGISYEQKITINIVDTIIVNADMNRIKQVIIILLDNAIKYGRTPCRIAATVKDQDNSVIVSVTDNGSGIVADEQKKIFDTFYRTVSPDGHKPDGSGLGLAIAKKIIESHGGTIWVESIPGKGCTFFFSLKVKGN
ncbi:MAG TPA: HAMP domain-containing sensor histidine kinase [Chitinispirillaceae bacterium]|nr:HAMP domain-containing sensor histidine kinase [Chitinispirillaceae bacterium]